MSVVTVKDRGRLRLGFEGSRGRTDPFGIDTQPPGRQTGVVVWGQDERGIPAGALIIARVDRPTTVQPGWVPEEHPNIPALQPYVFESAPRPPELTVGGAAQRRGRGPILHVTPANAGRFETSQLEPNWAVGAGSGALEIAPTPVGDPGLVPQGHLRHVITMPGQVSQLSPTAGLVADDPNLAPADAHLLRLRWTGTQVVGATLITIVAAPDLSLSGKFPTGHTSLVPGSIVFVVFPGLTFTHPVRDNGAGLLVGVGDAGERVNGRVNYVTGDWELQINNAAALANGDIEVTYEHSCPYAPIDVEVEWDALMAM